MMRYSILYFSCIVKFTWFSFVDAYCLESHLLVMHAEFCGIHLLWWKNSSLFFLFSFVNISVYCERLIYAPNEPFMKEVLFQFSLVTFFLVTSSFFAECVVDTI